VRATNNWQATTVNRNSIDETLFFESYELDLREDQTFSWRWRMADDTLVAREIQGQWEVISAKREIRLTFDQVEPSTGRELLFLTIRRLTSDQLWIEYLYDEDYYDVRLQ